jgi:hypothetical protein
MTTDEEFEVPDDALQEIAELAPNLTRGERLYVYWRTMAQPPVEAAKRAKLSGGWRKTETRPAVRKALQDLQEVLSPSYRVTRERVQGLIMEGIEIARRKDQAKIIIEGAVALANIAGVAAPQKMQIQSHTRHEEVTPNARPRLEHLPRDELERMIGVNRRLTTLPLEGEFQEVKPIEEEPDVPHG